MGILDRIKEVEEEIKRTQTNKATSAHLGRLKAKRAKLRSELLEGSKGAPGGGVKSLAVSPGHRLFGLPARPQ